MSIGFFTEDITFQLEEEELIKDWLNELAQSFDYEIEELNYIFCSDEHLHGINLQYLNHDTYTDIITFDHSEANHQLEADIFISIDRVRENAKTYKAQWKQELHRVMAHGLLHLIGFKDKTDEQKVEMRKREEACLSLLAKMK